VNWKKETTEKEIDSPLPRRVTETFATADELMEIGDDHVAHDQTHKKNEYFFFLHFYFSHSGRI